MLLPTFSPIFHNMNTMAQSINLAGKWNFALGDTPDYCASIQLPGSLQAQGFGNAVTVETPWTGQIVDRSWFTDERYAPYRRPGNVKIPFWLQPEKHYVGTAWYQREIEIPSGWTGRRVVLTLERAHIQTTVFVDGLEIGTQNSLSAPHLYDLGCGLAGRKHELAIRVDNRLHVDVGTNSSSVTDHTQTNWNGIIGRIDLSATAPVWIDDVQVYPDIARKSARVRVKIGNATGQPGQGRLLVGSASINATWDEAGGEAEGEVPLGDGAALWDEFHPAMHKLTVRLGEDERTVDFGLREVGVRGTQITVNGCPVFLRGTLECCVFPLTGYPSMLPAEWVRILAIIKDHGFNHVRFHSWCPPEAAFAAADELGLYFQIECSSWANTTTGLGFGSLVDSWLYEEAAAIIRAYGNHPSFLLMAYGNEPGLERKELTDYLARWVAHLKKADARRLYTSAAGWPAIPENDFHNIPEPRIQAWGQELNSRINALPPATTADYGEFVDKEKRSLALQHLQASDSWNLGAIEFPAPIVSHEIGQWCAYPDFSEIPKYVGLLKAKNFEIFQETLTANHMGGQAQEFLMASGKLQTICYKEEIESALRTKGFGGFQILQANDFPGQGTATVGWLNPFWESKGYVSPEEFRRFNNSTVVLARLAHRVFSVGDKLQADIEVAHFGDGPMEAARPYWKLTAVDGFVHATGELPSQMLPVGNGIALGRIEVLLNELPAPQQYRLVAGLAGTEYENGWDVWVYPDATKDETPENVLVIRKWDDLLQQAHGGRRILFNPEPGEVNGSVGLGFSTIFWNTAWTKNQAPHTLGILCDPLHPLFASFPTEFHSNWQWWELIHGAEALEMDGLPTGLHPLVQVIDDWFANRRLGLVFEVRLNDCRVLVCGSQICEDLANRPAARQFRKTLLDYLAGDAFDPQIFLDPIPIELRRA